MKLIFNDYEDYWVWVHDLDHDNELSPAFDEQHFAMRWLMNIADEFKNEQFNEMKNIVEANAQRLEELAEIKEGERVICPITRQHAEAMLAVAKQYLETH